MTPDLHIRNRMKLRSKFCFLQNETFLAKRVPAVSYMVFLICGMLLYFFHLITCATAWLNVSSVEQGATVQEVLKLH